jgi:hypothetical protein
MCDFSTNSMNFDEIVHIDAPWVVVHQEMHGRCELRLFGEVDLRPEVDLPRRCTLKLY